MSPGLCVGNPEDGDEKRGCPRVAWREKTDDGDEKRDVLGMLKIR